MNSNGFVLKHNITCVESNSNTYSLFKLFIVILFLLQLRISPRKKRCPNRLSFGFGPYQKFFKVKKMYKEANEKGTEEEGEENEEKIELLLLCCCFNSCENDEAIDIYPHPTHLFPGVIANCERTKKQQDSIILFNSNHMLLIYKRKNTS